MGVLEGQVAIVTGGGQGIGRGIALALAGEGARVLVVGRTLATCEAVAGEIADRGGTALAMTCDVVDRAQVDASVQRAIDTLGRIDLVVNNAQITSHSSVLDLTEDDADAMWQSGPMGALRLMQACFPHLKETQGCVVNLGSGMSIQPQVRGAGYGMVKDAMRVLTRVAALEWAGVGIRVNTIVPMALSPLVEEAERANPGTIDRLSGMIPLQRLGDAEADIGRSVVYLASDAARYVTGTTLMVDGGYRHLG